MPKLIVDEIGAYMVAGQLRDPQGAMMVEHFVPQSGVNEVLYNPQIRQTQLHQFAT